MESEIRSLIEKEGASSSLPDFAKKIIDQYFDYYLSQAVSTKQQMRRLIGKYNSDTIKVYLGEEGDLDAYVHVQLWHETAEKTIVPMLDNDGGIYPADLEIGAIFQDPHLGDWNESGDKEDIRFRLHNIIFYALLSMFWIEAKGHNARVVVKIDDGTAWYLNDFEFEKNSKFHFEHNWEEAIRQYNMESIEPKKLIENIKKWID